jgi:CubicO group peptidase (beta-lactamase class C family)
MQLQEEKKLSVTDKLSSYFPDLPNSDKITIEHLLTHTSGLYNYTKDPKVMKADVTRHYSSAEMLAVLKNISRTLNRVKSGITATQLIRCWDTLLKK